MSNARRSQDRNLLRLPPAEPLDLGRLKLFTVTEAAVLLRCSKSQVYELVQTGKLSGFKTGRLTISEESIRRYLEACRV